MSLLIHNFQGYIIYGQAQRPLPNNLHFMKITTGLCFYPSDPYYCLRKNSSSPARNIWQSQVSIPFGLVAEALCSIKHHPLPQTPHSSGQSNLFHIFYFFEIAYLETGAIPISFKRLRSSYNDHKNNRFKS